MLLLCKGLGWTTGPGVFAALASLYPQHKTGEGGGGWGMLLLCRGLGGTTGPGVLAGLVSLYRLHTRLWGGGGGGEEGYYCCVEGWAGQQVCSQRSEEMVKILNCTVQCDDY